MHGRILTILAFLKLLASIHLTFAQTQLLTFDEIATTQSSGAPLSNGYGGLRWTNVNVLNGLQFGLQRAVVSPSNVVQTARSGQMLIYSGQPFDLDSAWVTAGSLGNTVLFSAVPMFGPVSLYTNTYRFAGNTATFLNFGFENITGVRLFATDSQNVFSMDNLTMTFPESRRPSLPGWFNPGEIYFTASDALAVGAGDLNHDGHSELVMSSRFGTTIGINTNGGFRFREILSTNFVTTGSANFIAVGDYSGDGHEDAIISTITQFGSAPTTRLIEFTNFTNFTTNGISNVFGAVAIGDFGGTNRLIAAPQFSFDIAAADFNADGRLDYATIIGDPQSIVVSANRGNGVFTRGANISLNPGHSAMAVSDFDSDNDMDIASVNQTTGTLLIAYNSGSATFPVVSNYVSGLARPISLASADLDGDGVQDIVIRSAFSGLSLVRGLGARRFATPIIITGGAGYPSTNLFPRSIALRDLNSDGAPDIAFISGTEVVTLYNIFPPRLNISRIEDIIQVHWTTNFAKGAVIEYTTELGPDAVWTQDTFPQFQIGNTRAIFDAGAAPQLFFRLRRPE